MGWIIADKLQVLKKFSQLNDCAYICNQVVAKDGFTQLDNVLNSLKK